MKNQLPIKFRGNFIGGGFRTTGYFLKDKGKFWIKSEGGGLCQVEPDSVKQLVGYDKNGREVYDGDALQTKEDGAIYAAILRHAKIEPCDDMEFTEMAKHCGWTVKESAENDVQ